MSRIGRRPIPIPAGVKVAIDLTRVVVEGPRGKLQRDLLPLVKVEDTGSELLVTRLAETTRHRSAHGLSRTLVANMVIGVSTGFEKKLRLVGNGYRAAVQGKNLQLSVGYSHQVNFPIPDGITVTIGTTETVREGGQGVQHIPITLSGIDKEHVGQTAATIRAIKEAEVYTPSKGFRYDGEKVRLLPRKARA